MVWLKASNVFGNKSEGMNAAVFLTSEIQSSNMHKSLFVVKFNYLPRENDF